MSGEMKSLVEKYCPVVQHNVAVEISGENDKASCLNAHVCHEERGGCRNTLFPGERDCR